MIVKQKELFTRPQLQSIKSNLCRKKQQEIENVALQVRESLPPPKQREWTCMLCEKMSSSWLSVLPLQDQGFNLNKGEFRDAISLRYGWQLKNVLHHCKCGKNFSADHAMICPYSGLSISRHNEIRDITTKWLTEVYTDVEKEPQLQPLTGETILPRSANKQEEARVNIRANGFWNKQQNAFFDVRVFHPTHRATETQRSQHSTGNRRVQRRGNMETV